MDAAVAWPPKSPLHRALLAAALFVVVVLLAAGLRGWAGLDAGALLVLPAFATGALLGVRGGLTAAGAGCLAGVAVPLWSGVAAADALMLGVPLAVAQLAAGALAGRQHQRLRVARSALADQRDVEEQVTFMAYHDLLTSLPNRLLFTDRLQVEMTRARKHSEQLAVIFVDVDRFKVINDSIGHEAGDEVVSEVATRLKAGLGEHDALARFAGDKFVRLCGGLRTASDADKVAAGIAHAMKAPFRVRDRPLNVTVTMGIASFPSDGNDASTLLRNAEVAMYRGKEKGRNTCETYDPSMNARAAERLGLETDLRTAPVNGELRVFYQPEVDARTGRVVGVEALIRWQHPRLGLVSPMDFIPLVEEAGMADLVGGWVLRTACAQARVWQRMGHSLRLGVNVSARQVTGGRLMRDVEAALGECGLPPGLLELEITESIAMNEDAAALQTLEELTGKGIRIAIDDFGTGYSSLSRLRRLPVQRVKIDRAFVMNVDKDERDTAMVSAIVALARALKIDVISEGVETPAQREKLVELGSDQLQGYYFARPLPREELTRRLSKTRGSVVLPDSSPPQAATAPKPVPAGG
ncbi:MAG: EAL domain-containing protein [Deltaproteobacteria bacterium]|nr:EAL domain-containing protein [Deltaproteobacteria bacterium]